MYWCTDSIQLTGRQKGFEWTEALKNMTETQYPVWWFRHDWNDCPEQNSRTLDFALDSLKTNIERS